MGFWAEQVTRYQELLAALSSSKQKSVVINGVEWTEKDIETIQKLLLEAEQTAQALGQIQTPASTHSGSGGRRIYPRWL